MNREPNKEIEILLRKLSGKQNGDAAAAEGNSSANASEHLDADELSAYAENALPASLRSHYTEHVADCNSCRKLVTQLSLSSTAAIVRAPVEESAPSRLKALLAGLFSPLLIRYAIPAMAVILVVAIAWIVVRREPVHEQVAQNIETRTQPALPNQSGSPAVDDQISNESSAPQKGLVEHNQPQPQGTPSEDRAAVTSAGNKAPEESKEGEVAAKRDQAPPAAPVSVVAPSAGTGTGAVAQPKAASEVERNEPEPRKKAEADVAKAQNQIQNQQERRIYEQNRSGPSEPKAVQRGVNTQNSNESQRELARQRASEREAQAKDKASDDEAEVRTVGGHKFTKRGRVWVDALYDSDSATTNVSRGSDQYRSLMGDEPGLRAIVEQLSGEVLVVWKSRSYRIK
jgi:hypothetical protein